MLHEHHNKMLPFLLWAASSHLISNKLGHSALECNEMAPATAKLTGLYENGTCGWCGAKCEGSEGLQGPSVVYTKQRACTRTMCMTCPLFTPNVAPPPGTYMYITANCTYFDPSIEPVTVGLPYLTDATLMVPDKGATLSHALLTKGDFTHTGGQLTINTPDEQCAIRATNFQSAFKLNIGTVAIKGPAKCGLLLSTPDRSAQVTADVTSISSNDRDFEFELAAANIHGTITFTDAIKTSIIVDAEQSRRLTLTPPATHVMNLSELLNVYGNTYEIEFFNDGQLDEEAPWDVHEANWALTYSALALGLLYFGHTPP
jgi:hypothetical protein